MNKIYCALIALTIPGIITAAATPQPDAAVVAKGKVPSCLSEFMPQFFGEKLTFDPKSPLGSKSTQAAYLRCMLQKTNHQTDQKGPIFEPLVWKVTDSHETTYRLIEHDSIKHLFSHYFFLNQVLECTEKNETTKCFVKSGIIEDLSGALLIQPIQKCPLENEGVYPALKGLYELQASLQYLRQ